MPTDTLPLSADERIDAQGPAAANAAAHAFYLANRDGIDAWNAFVAEHGLPLVDTWDF